MSHRTFPARPHFGDPPVGSVIAFAGNLGASVPATASPPDAAPPAGQNVTQVVEAWGWMLCDGRTLAINQYPELFAVLGNQYGGDFNTNSFNIPDYRGYFLRGVDDGSGNDPDIAVRTVPAGGTGTAAQAGSIQNYALLEHAHDYQSAAAMGTPTGSGNAAATNPVPQPASTTNTLSPDGNAFSPASLVSQSETRPKNIYVNYLIKFTYGHR